MVRRTRPMPDSIAPLGDAERAELQALLERGRGVRSLDETFGMFAALATAPTPMSPNDWLMLVLGDINFHDQADLQRALDLLMRAYNGVVEALMAGADVAPGPEAPDDVAAAWCRGYLAIAETDDAWHEDEDGDAMLMPLSLISGDFSLIGEEDEDGNVITDDTERRQRARHILRDSVKQLHAYWLAHRLPSPARSTKQGRNEPCACGSGKKYKRCCGAVH